MIKVYCRYDNMYDSVSIYIVETNLSDEMIAVWEDLGNSKRAPKCKKILQGTQIEPTIRLSGMVAKPFLQAMANAVKEFGIVAEDEPILGNELTAVRYHLEDMRKLVFGKEEYK